MWIHIPIFFLLALILFLLLLTAGGRIRAVKKGEIALKDIRFVEKSVFPERVRLIGNSYESQFQQPMMFIVLLLFLHTEQASGQFWFVMSTAFVAARYWHCYEHVLGTNLRLRTLAFAFSSLCLFTAWFRFLWEQI
ncbi:MAPEG family protein [Pseudoalteromonas sp. T1lg65]|uniref:MAPEG family protein n=1 Tax=Pseudoalteromonas sp. T1lg65 TaxID=2077101 RepID=UPI003F797C97